jgi:hypothetical protein
MERLSEKASDVGGLPRWLDLRPLGLVALAGAMVWATSIGASTWKSVRAKPVEREIRVTGSAKKRIVSDLIQWEAVVEAHAADRTAAYKILHEEADKAVAFLRAQGINEAEIAPQSASFEETFETQFVGVGPARIEKKIPTGYETRQVIVVRSSDVARVEKASREITTLLEQGVEIASSSPAYFYTKLGELKVEMLAAAAKDARARADNIVRSAGGASIASMIDADMGIININPANSTTTSEEGNNDTGSLEKDIITIVHARFQLE